MKHWQPIIIVVLTFIIIVLIMRSCAQPGEEREAEREKQHKTAIAILEADKNAIQARQDSIIKVSTERTRKDSVAISRYNEQIAVLKKKVVIKRIYVQPLIDSIPTLRSFVELQDSLIQVQGVTIDTLKAQAEFQRQLYSGLITQEFIEDKIANQMAIESQRRIAELEKSAKKKERGKRLWKFLAVIGAGLGFAAGASL